MNKLVRLCLARPITTTMIHVSLVIVGILAIPRLPLNALPKSERPIVSVRVEYPNASPEQVEREVTRKLEEVLATLSGVVSMNGNSERGSGRVRLEFDWGTNLDLVKVEVRERVARILDELPTEDLDRIRITGAWNSGDAIIKGRISAEEIDLSENFELLVDRIERPLERLEGVSQVELEGVLPKEIVVTVRRDDLERYGIRFDELFSRLQQHDTNATIAEVRIADFNRKLRIVGGFKEIEDVRSFPVDATGLRLDEVAKIELREGELRFGRHLNGSFAVSIEVFKESSANTVETSRRIKEEVEKLRDDPVLSGVDLLVWDDQGEEIVRSLESLELAGLIGSLLAIGILYLFLRRFLATALVGIAIPISVLASLAVMFLMGRELNIITIIALMLGIGMLVDTAVVVVESIVRHIGLGASPRKAAERGTLEVATPIFAATVTSIIVFVPVGFGDRNQQTDYFVEVGLVISLTLALSLFVSLTLIPMVAARVFKEADTSEGKVFPKFRKTYSAGLHAVLRHPWRSSFVLMAIVMSTILPFKGGFQVDMDDVAEVEKNVSVFYRTDESLDFRTMEGYVEMVEDTLRPYHEELGISDVYSWYKDGFAWTALYPDDPMQSDELAALATRVDELLPQAPGVAIKTGDWGMFWGRRGSRTAGSLQVALSGESNDKLQSLIGELEEKLLQTPGIRTVERRYRNTSDELQIRPEIDALESLDLSSRDVSSVVTQQLAGRRIRELRTSGQDLELEVRMEEDERDSIEEVEGLRLPATMGEGTSLDSIASLEVAKGPGELRRENRQSTARFSVQVEPEFQDRARSIVEPVVASFPFPRGYDYEIGGGWRQRQANSEQFKLILLLAVFLVFFVMACLFESLLQPLLIMTTVVLAIPGVIWFLYLGGDKLDMPAAIGVVLLAGIVVNNGIVFVDHVNRYLREGSGVVDAIVAGGAERLRPILITAITTITGLLPMAYSGEAKALLEGIGVQVGSALDVRAGGAYYFSLARAIIGGLTVSTVLTLFGLPLGILAVERIRATARRRLAWVKPSVDRQELPEPIAESRS